MRALALLLALAVAGCVGTGADDSLQVRLTALPRNAGQIGQATLSPRGEQTSVSAFVSGVPPDMTLPVRLYAFIYQGRCAALGQQPAYALNDTVTTRHQATAAGWHLSRSADAPLARLRATPHALVLRAPPANGGYDLFCGDIP